MECVLSGEAAITLTHGTAQVCSATHLGRPEADTVAPGR